MSIRPKTPLHHFSLLSALALSNVLLQVGCSDLISTRRGLGKLVELCTLILVGGGTLNCSALSAAVAALAEGGGGINMKPL